ISYGLCQTRMVSRMFDQTCCYQLPTCSLFPNALDVCVGRAALPFAVVALKRLVARDTVPPCEYELRDNGGMSHSSFVDRLRRERIPGAGKALQPKGISQVRFRRTADSERIRERGRRSLSAGRTDSSRAAFARRKTI